MTNKVVQTVHHLVLKQNPFIFMQYVQKVSKLVIGCNNEFTLFGTMKYILYSVVVYFYHLQLQLHHLSFIIYNCTYTIRLAVILPSIL